MRKHTIQSGRNGHCTGYSGKVYRVQSRFITLFLSLFVGIAVHAGEKPNILFIAIDDLRPELGCYGSKIAQSPNLDKLAAEGLLFQNAYCNQAICSPSRASIMTGCRPDTIGIIENRAYFRDLNPDILTLPQHFIANGYDALFSGKIYHNTGSMADLGKSWNTEVDRPKGLKRGGGYAIKENIELVATRRKEAIAKYGAENTSGLTSGLAIEAADVDDNAYSDGYNTTVAIHTLDRLVETGKPFFLGLGMKRPHLPFTAPKKYFDLYNPDDIELAKPASPPKNGATVGLHPSFELRTRAEIPNAGPIDDDLSRRLLHAYYACVSYVDAQIGRMIEALETKGIRDNTIIIVWGDHGWHLGEHGIWGKATNYEIATRVPLLIWTPDMKVRGQQTDALVELVDMYPTLCELAGLKVPEHLEGKSFAPLLDKPELDWKPVAISQFPSPALREWAANPLSQGMRETYFGPLIEDVEAKIKAQFGGKWNRDLFENHLMGYTVRSEKYRMVTWVDYRNKSAPPLFVELYDHSNDPDETINVAEANPEVVAQLTKELHQSLGW